MPYLLDVLDSVGVAPASNDIIVVQERGHEERRDQGLVGHNAGHRFWTARRTHAPVRRPSAVIISTAAAASGSAAHDVRPRAFLNRMWVSMKRYHWLMTGPWDQVRSIMPAPTALPVHE